MANRAAASVVADGRVTTKVKRRSFFHRMWDYRLSYLFILPALLLVVVFLYYPAGSAFFYAFTDWHPTASDWGFVGFKNFAEIFNKVLLKATVNMVIYTVANLVKWIAMCLLSAVLVFHLPSRRIQYWLRTVFISPMLVPSMATVLIWKWIYEPEFGLVNQALRSLGLDSLALAWLQDEDIALWAMIAWGFPWVWTVGFLVLLGGLMSIPMELYDAVAVDGASAFRRFFAVELPLIMGQIRVCVVLTFIASIQGFWHILVLTEGGPRHATTTPALEMYLIAFQEFDYGKAHALGLLLFGLILAGTILNMRIVRSAAESQV